MAVIRALVLVALLGAPIARAQPGAVVTSDVLRESNAAALAGDWARVARQIEPLLARELAAPDLGEAHRLAGLAAFFQQRGDAAERHFLAYLQIDPDGRLDPALYPPDVVAAFNDVASRHAPALRALRTMRTPPNRSWILTLLPPIGQYQNGDHIKAYAIGGALVASLAVNLTTYSLLRRWCNHTDGTSGGTLTCDEDGDHTRAAMRVRPYNIASGIAVLAIYAYGVVDGIVGYRRRSRAPEVQPYVAGLPGEGGGILGLAGRF